MAFKLFTTCVSDTEQVLVTHAETLACQLNSTCQVLPPVRASVRADKGDPRRRHVLVLVWLVKRPVGKDDHLQACLEGHADQDLFEGLWRLAPHYQPGSERNGMTSGCSAGQIQANGSGRLAGRSDRTFISVFLSSRRPVL